ncbi:MAG: hypothetical protein KBT27_08620 [Prevotellaceae bacterium]|nr:hypothetical protein [Candidatus Faecinaster equi]
MKQQDKELIMTCLSYETIFDDYETIDIIDLVKNIPCFAALEFISKKQSNFYYCLSDLKGQKNELFELRCTFFSDEIIKSKFDNFIMSQESPYLIDNISTLYFFLLLLQYGDKKNTEFEISLEQKQNIYKAYLYCSNLWLDVQQKNVEGLNPLDLNLKVDVPVTEFKFPADFHSQLYKANEFFVYCQSDNNFKTISDWLIADKGKNNFQEYLLDIFELFRHTIDNNILRKSNLPQATHWFLDMYAVDFSSEQELWSNRNNGIKYLRDNFFVKFDNDRYLLLYPSFLIDKFYQGLVFDSWKAIEKRQGGDNTLAESFQDLSVLKSRLGQLFSEEHLFYTIMDKCFTSTSIVKKKGSELIGVEAPPDYYLRNDNNIFFFECKDILFNNNDRYSTDIDKVKKAILDRICKDGDTNRKGAGQLLYTINKYINEDSLAAHDRKYKAGDNIYPVVVTTNNVYDAYGVNILVLARYIEIVKAKYPSLAGKVKLPIIINIDCFVRLMYDLHNGNKTFNQLLDDYQELYLNGQQIMMPSFYHYIRTLYHQHQMTREEHQYLFGSTISSFNKIIKS